MHASTGGTIGSADDSQKKRVPRIVYKDDVEAVARSKAEADAIVQEDGE